MCGELDEEVLGGDDLSVMWDGLPSCLLVLVHDA